MDTVKSIILWPFICRCVCISLRMLGWIMNWDIVGKARIFEQLDSDTARDIFEQLHPKCVELNKNDILIRDGQLVNSFAIVEEGALNAAKLYADGSQSLLLKFEPSYVAAVDIAATKKKVSTYYITAGKKSKVHLIDYNYISKPGKIREEYRLLMMESVLALIAGENIRKMYKIEILSRKGLRDKILVFLAIQQSFYGEREFKIAYNREELADYLCVNRSALSHELRSMEQEHLIYCRKNYFKILDARLYNRDELR